MTRILTSLALLMLASGQALPSEAATVRPLSLPFGFTVAPEADRRLMTVGPDGTVFAVAESADSRERTRALRWSTGAEPAVLAPLDVQRRPRYGGAELVIGTVVAAKPGAAYVTVAQSFSGAYMGTTFEAERWPSGDTASRWSMPVCASERYLNPHVFAADARGRVALTLDPSSDSSGIDLADDAAVERNLPIAAVIEGDRCTVLGSAILTGIRGTSVVGYRGYLEGKAAPWFVNLMVQRMVALRWVVGIAHAEQLGAGVPFATTEDGFTVGASALTGHANEAVYGNFFGPAGRYAFAIPHAMAWDRRGHALTLVHSDVRSVAWDVADDETVVGMLQTADQKHLAFRWRHGHVAFLDDLPHPPGWRFESAYAIAPDGAIVGIGTYRGVATAFVWRE